MSSDDDADELAALRAQRAARLGGAATLSQLRELQRRADAADAGIKDYIDDSDRKAASSGGHASGQAPMVGPPRPPVHQQGAQGPSGGYNEGSDDDEGEEDTAVAAVEGGGPASSWFEEPDRTDEAVWGQLPLCFGPQETKVENPYTVHGAFQRSASARDATGPGGPSLSSARVTASFGPPRPPGRGTAAAGGGGGGKGSSSSAFGLPRPPPREAPNMGGGAAGGTAEAEQGPSRRPANIDLGTGKDAEAEEVVGPSRPPQSSEDGDDHDDASDADADLRVGMDDIDDEDDDPYGLPITHEAILKGHSKAVSCLDVEYTGTRMVTGSYDYGVRIYDFHGMKSDMRSFRDLEPSDGHPVFSVSWSPSGDAFLAVTGAAQAKIYDRDGRALGEFIRGDMYIRDARNTRGHISGLTGGWWHPTDRYTAITSSEDGTVRVWDTHNLLQKTVIKPSLARPTRTAVTAVSYNSTGSLIGAGLVDGTIQVWCVGGKFGVSAAVGQVLPPKPQMVEKQGWTYVSKPSQIIRDAHQPATDITSLCFSADNHSLLSRGMDGTLKLWDLRRFKTPVHVHSNLPAAYAQTRAIFSPDESLILTGTGGSDAPTTDGGSEGALVFFSRAKNELIRKVGMPGNVTALTWHHRLNQIFVGIGNRGMGETHALYDLTRSERGVVTAASRRPQRTTLLTFTPPLIIKTPHALPMFRDDPAKKRKAEREAIEARRPDLGMVAGRGKQGRLGATGGTLLTQHLLKQRGGLMAPEHEPDPREAILRHADKAKEEFSAWTAAYRDTQPKPVYMEEQEDED